MLTEKQNEQLTRVGPGTPMGELFRRYWHPVAAVSQMKERKTFQVKILGEDLVLYKDRSGGYADERAKDLSSKNPGRRSGAL